MNFSEQPPSTQWGVLRYKGETIAEAWFKPEGEPDSLKLRIPQKSLQIAGMDQLLTLENLLKSLAIPLDEVESWSTGSGEHADLRESVTELKQPLAPLLQDIDELNIQVFIKNPESFEDEESEAEAEDFVPQWQAIETRWNSILAVEATIETNRQRIESLRNEMDSAAHKNLSSDEKANANNADVAQWNKAKSRLRYVIPKLKEFIHRATWAIGAPERKKMEELFKNHVVTRLPCPELSEMPKELDSLFKMRQVLSAQGVSVLQEGQSSLSETSGALRLLQSNASANAQKKRVATRAKNK